MFSCLSPENMPSATTGSGEHLCRASKNQDQIFAVHVQDFLTKTMDSYGPIHTGLKSPVQSCLFL